MSTPITRRDFLLQSALYSGALWAALNVPRPQALAAAAESSTPLVLTPTEWKAVEAITARIIPSDAEPGALEAEVVNFIDKALAHEDAAALPRYQAALRALDLVCRARHDAAFEALAPEAQDALLRELEDGAVPGWSDGDADPAAFFATLREHAILGFLCEPPRGGNRDYAGWRVVQFPGPAHELGGATPEQMLGQLPFPAIWGGEIE
jgi:gluconate 2-dehydrogenase gamma chain